ncbi:MAG: hypothetical protein ACK5PB_08255, partial [Pirellula sp.]
MTKFLDNSEKLAHSIFKVQFVCLGNICRSPAAQGIMARV